MKNQEVQIREAIGKYVELLKKERGITLKQIVEMAANVSNTRSFSEATLVRCYNPEKQDKHGEKSYYSINSDTLEIIGDTLRAILRNECTQSSEFEDIVLKSGIDLSPSEDFSSRQMTYRKTITLENAKAVKLYTWEETKRLEMESTVMYVITPDLANCARIIDDLLEATDQNKNKKSFYILTDSKGQHNKDKIEEKINNHNNKDLKKRIQILTLYDKPLYSEALGMQYSVTAVPVPFNVAVYFDVIDPFTGEMEIFLGAASAAQEKGKQGADFMFGRERAQDIINWFDKVWKGLAPKENGKQDSGAKKSNL